jgi:hypothetical protein
MVMFRPNNLTTFLRQDPARIEPEGTIAQSNVVTSEEIDVVTEQQKILNLEITFTGKR